ncbi:hypothetical protein SDC9_170174 [bioreactor metagenome]|uniref:Uncharacterized protein n=1 Tax=bioreactor metagenome TaxID=1076179 RepID=A0A645G9U0_9ZZZZ
MRHVAGVCHQVVVTRRRNPRCVRADRAPELFQLPDRVFRGILIRTDKNVRVAVQFRERRFRPRLFGSGHRVAADEDDAARFQPVRRPHHGGLAASEVRNDRSGAEEIRAGGQVLFDLRQRQREQCEVGLPQCLFQ